MSDISSTSYSVRITTIDGDDEARVGLSLERLMAHVIDPRSRGDDLWINGRCIQLSNIHRIQITETTHSRDELAELVESEHAAFALQYDFYEATPATEWEMAWYGRDVTDDFIVGPPGSTNINSRDAGSRIYSKDRNAVFVIHGRNLVLREAMFQYLEALGLRPLEWSELVTATGEGTPYIGDVLDSAFNVAQAVVVLMTPDDEARLRSVHLSPSDPAHERYLNGQARPNVIFEAGLAFGRHPTRTIVVEIGEIRPFSDLVGRHTIRLDNSPEKRHSLAQRLHSAGCEIDLNRPRWLQAGNFDPPTPPERSAEVPGHLQVSDRAVLRDVITKWPEVREAVRLTDRKIDALLGSTDPVGYAQGTVTLAATYPFHAGKLKEERIRRFLEDAFLDVMGWQMKVDVILREPNLSDVTGG